MSQKRSEYQKKYQEVYNARNKRVNLTFNKSEYVLLLRAARLQDMPPSRYAKEMTLKGMQDMAVIPKNIEYELKEVKFLLRNIANNINQIAHHSNIVHELTQSSENNLLQYLKQLENTVQQYTEGRILDAQRKDYDN